MMMMMMMMMMMIIIIIKIRSFVDDSYSGLVSTRRKAYVTIVKGKSQDEPGATLVTEAVNTNTSKVF